MPRSERPNLLVTTSTLPRFHTDSEARFVLDLARHLRPWFKTTILAPCDPEAAITEHLDDVRIVRYRYAPARQAEVLCYPGAIMSRLRRNPVLCGLVPLLLTGLRRAIARELRTTRYACVHAHWFMPQGLVQALAFSSPGDPPFVVTSHGGDMALQKYPLIPRAYRTVVRRAAALTVVAPQIRDSIRRLAPATAVDRIPVIPMGVDPARFTSSHRDGAWRARHGLTGPVMLFVGRLVEKKGVHVLLDALAMLPLGRTGASLAIIGDGPMRGRLEAQAGRLGIASRVRFLGPMPHDDVAVAFASCELYCAPSITGSDGDRDGMPTVLCEAAASGLPLVGSRLAGIPLVIRDGVTGALVPPGDAGALSAALARLVVDQGVREVYGRAARQHAGTFAWPRIAERYADVLMRAAGLHDDAADRDRETVVAAGQPV